MLPRTTLHKTNKVKTSVPEFRQFSQTERLLVNSEKNGEWVIVNREL